MQAGARATNEAHLDGLLAAGAVGFKIHEDNGAYPDLIDWVLRYADARDLSVSLHTDGLHESAELEDTVAAIGGRTVHAYHVEGTGGGHVPDLLGLVREPSIICSSTTPTLPFGVHTAAEHVPMTVLNHGLSWAIPDDVALVRERVLEARMAAEGPLHELGAISIINSDSQGMGRIGETLRRTFQLAHVMKAWRRSGAAEGVAGLPADEGLADPDDRDDTARVLRYLAKATIEPAITHGIADHVGSLRPGCLADIVLWKPGFFGVKPEWVFKGGFPAWGPLGEGNATVERAEPTRYRADWAGVSTAAPKVSATFVSAGLSEAQVGALRTRLGTRRTLLPVGGVRGITRDTLHANRATPAVEIDVRSGAVSLGAVRLGVDPVEEVPLSRRYLLR
jgi:urease subunit alpha